MAELNLFKIALQHLKLAAKHLGLDEATHAHLREPECESIFQLSLRMDNGQVRHFKGFLIQYSDARGPVLCSLRFHPQVTLDAARALAALMSWKTALMELPMGGACGGLICNPKELSFAETERLCRAYMRTLVQLSGRARPALTPDVFTNPQAMAWMMDELENLQGGRQLVTVLSKPLHLGGSLGRDDAVARGGIYCVREALQLARMDAKKSAYAIQGFGNSGQYAALLHRELLGGNLVAVSDASGGVYRAAGLDPRRLVDYKNKNGRILGFPESEPISHADLLELPVDVLYPSALENVITEQNAGRIKAKIICELANSPIALEAEEILQRNKVFVIPDCLANAGGITVNYFELVQNSSGCFWSALEITQKLEAAMVKAFHNAHATMEKHHINLRTAAYMVAVARVAEALRLRGRV